MSRVVVHIDRLVVAGAPAERREIEAAVAEAMRRELARPGAVEAIVAAGDQARLGGAASGAGPAAAGDAIGRSLTGRGPR